MRSVRPPEARSRSRARSALFGLLVLAVALAGGVGCVPRWKVFQPDRAVRPKVVGVVLPLSGKYQQVGETLRAGIELALAGSSIELVVRDSKGEADAAERAVEELVSSSGVIAILGGVTGDEARAVARRADALWVPVISFSKAEGVTSEGRYVFRVLPSLKAQARAVGEYATCKLGVKRFAAMAPETDYGRELVDAFAAAVEQQGGTLVQREGYQAEQTTFTNEARRLTGRFDLEKRPDFVAGRAKIQKEESDPFRRRKALERLKASLPAQADYQALFLADGWKAVSMVAPALAVEELVTNGCNAGELERIRKTTGRKNLQQVTLLGWGGWSSPLAADGTPELLARGGKYLDCSVYVDPFFPGSARPATQRFVARFRQAHGGQTPSLLQAVGHDAALLVRHVLERSAPADSVAFFEQLSAIQGVDGAMGRTSFDGSREAVRPLFLLKVEEGTVRELSADVHCS